MGTATRGRTDDGHAVFADSPFESESESPLHWRDERALAEAESRPTAMDASPYGASNNGYGVGRSESNEYGVGSGERQRRPRLARLRRGVHARGEGLAVYDLDLRGSTLLAYNRTQRR
jgi:hypothetical protein